MKVQRFSAMGPGWEDVARARYPGLFLVLTVERIRTCYGIRTKDDGSIPRQAGDAVWLGEPTQNTAGEAT